MSSSYPQVMELNQVWSDLMREIRHAQVNELQLLRSYVKLQNLERLDRCVALTMERLDQERLLMGFGNALWTARLMPFVYGINGVRFQIESLTYDAMMPCTNSFEQAWTYSGWVAEAFQLAASHAERSKGIRNPDGHLSIQVRFIVRSGELMALFGDGLLEWKAMDWSILNGHPVVVDSTAGLGFGLVWKLEEV